MDPVAFVENFQTDDLTLEAAFALWGSPHPEQIEADYFDDTVALFRPESDDPQVHLELEGRSSPA